MSDPSTARLLSRLRSSMETTKRRTWFELQRCHYFAHPPTIATHAELALALQHFHATATDAELRLLFALFPDGRGGFSFRAFGQHLYPLNDAAPPPLLTLHPTPSSLTPSTPSAPASVTVSRIPSPSTHPAPPSPPQQKVTSASLRQSLITRRPRAAVVVKGPRPAKYFHRPSPLGRVFDVSERPSSQATLRAAYTQQLHTGHWVRV